MSSTRPSIEMPHLMTALSEEKRRGSKGTTHDDQNTEPQEQQTVANADTSMGSSSYEKSRHGKNKVKAREREISAEDGDDDDADSGLIKNLFGKGKAIKRVVKVTGKGVGYWVKNKLEDMCCCFND